MALRFEHNTNGVMTCWLDNPARRNALNDGMLAGLTSVLTDAQGDSDVRMIVIRGDHNTFCSGRDLGELKSDPFESEQARLARLSPVLALARAFDRCAVPIVVAVQGKAVGLGVAMSAWADIVVAADSSTFSVPEARSGVTPSITAVSLTRKAGIKASLALSLTGIAISSDHAMRFGMIQFLYPDAEFENGLEMLCQAILLGGPRSLSHCKRLLSEVQELSLVDALDVATKTALESMGSAEAEQGIAAFQGRRPAPWMSQLRS